MKKTELTHTSKGLSTRDRIVQAARRKLVESGYEAFVMRELADELNIKLGNLQYYFKTRDALILSVMQEEAAADITTITKHQRGETDAHDAFRAIVHDLVVRWRGDSGILFSTLGTLALHNREFKQLYRSIYATFYEALEAPLREMNPRLDQSEVTTRIRLITALIDGSSMQVRVGNLNQYLERIKAEAESIAKL